MFNSAADLIVASMTEEEKEKAFKAMKLGEQFNDWLYENYSIWNGDRLISLLEDGDVQSKFLSDMGLPEDTEL